MTQEEIFAEMAAIQAASPELTQLDSTSATSFWEQMKKLFAFMSARLFVMLSEHQTNIEKIYSTNRYGTEDWYRKKVLEFQFGDDLEVIEGELKYATVNENNRVVRSVKFITSSLNTMLVVVTGFAYDPVTKYKMSNEKVAALQGYMEEIKLLNTTITVRSEVADRVYLRVGIKINPLLLTSSGASVTASTVYPVKDYLKTIIEGYDGTTKPLTKFYLQQKLMTMSEVKFVDVSYMNSFSVIANDEQGAGLDLIDSVSGQFYFDPLSIITYV
ncbi:hypothetical protein VB796_20945 [Arcicella sp. LKC2W]|uniref:hypothetical protein n=1 Tax=Arcicella sp. LKC2W TaxID=2984198 RepID=UPI002B1E9375|nr:hypothetical protein [Arcicella sp. LKC2W]MEA5461547.1 hypothetical protein [Arcicella sp. LKC2W]